MRVCMCVCLYVCASSERNLAALPPRQHVISWQPPYKHMCVTASQEVHLLLMTLTH